MGYLPICVTHDLEPFHIGLRGVDVLVFGADAQFAVVGEFRHDQIVVELHHQHDVGVGATTEGAEIVHDIGKVCSEARTVVSDLFCGRIKAAGLDASGTPVGHPEGSAVFPVACRISPAGLFDDLEREAEDVVELSANRPVIEKVVHNAADGCQRSALALSLRSPRKLSKKLRISC